MFLCTWKFKFPSKECLILLRRMAFWRDTDPTSKLSQWSVFQLPTNLLWLCNDRLITPLGFKILKECHGMNFGSVFDMSQLSSTR
ncbi:unnamed protein product [Sphagnum troendelagicum]